MFVTLIVLHVLVAIALVLVVLLQTGRGAELGAAFGGVGQSTFGRSQATFITKVTTVLATVFMLTSLTLALLTSEQPSGSLLENATSTAAPPAQEEQAPAAPEQAPAATDSAPAQPVQPLQQQEAPAR